MVPHLALFTNRDVAEVTGVEISVTIIMESLDNRARSSALIMGRGKMQTHQMTNTQRGQTACVEQNVVKDTSHTIQG